MNVKSIHERWLTSTIEQPNLRYFHSHNFADFSGLLVYHAHFLTTDKKYVNINKARLLIAL
jgi:hypothetical protein